MARIQSNANDTGSIVRFLPLLALLEPLSLEPIEYDHRTIPSKLSSEWSLC